MLGLLYSSQVGGAGVGRKLTAASASTLTLGMALALLAVVWSALRAGSNTALFRLGLDDAAPADGAAQPLVDDEEGRAFVQARAPGWGPYPEAQGLPKGAVVVLDHAGAVGQK